MPIDPITALAVIKSLKDSPLGQVGAFFGKLVGALPRGDFQKFQRTIYPNMVGQADQTGSAVYAFWFGDVIRVAPGGAWGSIGVTGSIAGAEEIFKIQANKEGTIYVFRCSSGVDFNSMTAVQSGCSFDRMTGSFFGRVTRPFFDLFPGGDTAPTVDRGPGFPTTDSPFGTIPDVARQSGFGIDGTSLIFAAIAVVGLVFILPRLGKA